MLAPEDDRAKGPLVWGHRRFARNPHLATLIRRHPHKLGLLLLDGNGAPHPHLPTAHLVGGKERSTQCSTASAREEFTFTPV